MPPRKRAAATVTKTPSSAEEARAERMKRLRAVAATLNDDRKGYGAGTVLFASEVLPSPPRLSTGSLAIDVALGGGWPANQWAEIIGSESSGKTCLALQTVAYNQRNDPDFITVWCAAEGFDDDYAKMCGVDLSRVILVTTNIMEEAYQACLDYLQTRDVDLIVVDSLPALSPEMEWDKELNERAPGAGAFVTGLFFRKSYKATKRSLTFEERPVYGLMVNQYRSKLGVQYGDPRTTPGGEGKNYRFYTRVEVRRDEFITTQSNGKGDKVGQAIKIRTVKNKSAPPQQVAVVDFYFHPFAGHEAGRWDNVKEVAFLAMQFGVVTLRGSRYYYDEQSYQGREPLFTALREDEGLRRDMSKRVLDHIAAHRVALPDDPEMAAEEAAAARQAADRFARRVEGAVDTDVEVEEEEQPGDAEAREAAEKRREARAERKVRHARR